MATFYAVATVCSVTKVPKKELTRKWQILLHPDGIQQRLRILAGHGIKAVVYFFEYSSQSLRLIAAVAANVTLSGRGIEFNVGNASTVLTAVVLLLEEEIELLQTIGGSLIMLSIMLQWF